MAWLTKKDWEKYICPWIFFLSFYSFNKYLLVVDPGLGALRVLWMQWWSNKDIALMELACVLFLFINTELALIWSTRTVILEIRWPSYICWMNAFVHHSYNPECKWKNIMQEEDMPWNLRPLYVYIFLYELSFFHFLICYVYFKLTKHNCIYYVLWGTKWYLDI